MNHTISSDNLTIVGFPTKDRMPFYSFKWEECPHSVISAIVWFNTRQ